MYTGGSAMRGGTTMWGSSALFASGSIRSGSATSSAFWRGRGRSNADGGRSSTSGAGGGLLAEEFARAGFEVTGVDPAPESIQTARTHAEASGLRIDYRTAAGERLPFPDASFDHAACCDVLEHVDDLDSVIREIARVLTPGGLFFFDTVNRTLVSKIAVIKLMQEWQSTAFGAPDSHIWEKFIKPAELTARCERYGIELREMRGIAPRANPLAVWLGLRRRAQGKITFRELGRLLDFQESQGLSASYMGYAVKRVG